jgi:hypothetical protein
VTHSHCGTCHKILAMLEAATATPWPPEERAALLVQAEASIKESERAMLLPAKVQTDRIQ